jgi:hypothetical protein
VPGKDVVVPVDVQLPAAELAKLPAPDNAAYACHADPRLADGTPKVLLFMGGSMNNMGRVEYSQGVRQQIAQHHSNRTDFVLGGKFTLDQLREARFCLAPSGWGWGWRLQLTMLTQCVPVIIQPNVTQPFEDFLPYDALSLRLSKGDIPRLPELLLAVPQARVCAMQTALAKYYRAMLWQRPHGPPHPNAYDMTMLSLCNRARRLKHARSRRNTGAGFARLPLDCAETPDAAGLHFL